LYHSKILIKRHQHRALNGTNDYINYGSEYFEIGTHTSYDGGMDYNGGLDEAAFYNKKLTYGQVASHYRMGRKDFS
jgi:hypothetical protein